MAKVVRFRERGWGNLAKPAADEPLTPDVVKENCGRLGLDPDLVGGFIPLTEGAGNPKEVFSGAAGILTASNRWSMTASGMALASTGASFSAVEWHNRQFLTTSKTDGTGNFSVLFVGAPGAEENINYCGGQREGGSPYKQVTFIANSTNAAGPSSGSMAFGYYDGSWRLVAEAAKINGKVHAYLGRRAGSEVCLFVDGTKGTPATKNTSSVVATTQSVAVCGNPQYTIGPASLGPQLLWLYLNGAVSDSVAASLTINWPLLLFPRPRRVFVDLGGGGGAVEFAASAAGASATSQAALGVLRVLQAAPLAVSATGIVTLTRLVDMQALGAIETSTADAGIAVVRDLAAAPSAATETGMVAVRTIADLAANVQATTATADAALGVVRDLVAAAAGQTQTSAAELLIAGVVEFAANAQAGTQTSAAMLRADRSLAASIQAGTVTSDIAVQISGFVEFAAQVAASSETSQAQVATIRELAASIQGQGQTPEPILRTVRDLVAAVQAQVQTSEAQARVERNLTATVEAGSLTLDAVAGITRLLSASAQAVSQSSDPELTTANIITLAAAVVGSTQTSAASVQALRDLSAAASAASQTSAPAAGVLRSLGASISAETLTSAVELLTAGVETITLTFAARWPKVTFQGRQPSVAIARAN